jgi:hypothetical protein
VPGLSLHTDAFVLQKRPPADAFQACTVFSLGHGNLHVLQRLPKKPGAAGLAPLDLFDEAALMLESANQGRTWFVKETRLITRATGIGRSYDTLRLASAFASLIARNPVGEESRPTVGHLLRQALAAFATATRPDIAYFKAVYCFARDEGHPVKQHWLPTLAAADRAVVIALLNRPLAAQTAAPADVGRLQTRLEQYLQGHTELLLA